MALLEFLIPSYRRPESVLRAINSVATQVAEGDFRETVRITVVDDASDNVDLGVIRDAFPEHHAYLSITRNVRNKGMSRNIRDMVKNSTASFCTVLTDDDRLQPGALVEIIDLLNSGLEQMGCDDVGSFYVPRISYLEDGRLHCIVCKPFAEDSCIPSGALSSIKHCHDGFILTGLFFKPHLIDFNLWDANIDNAFFPIIYFADLVRRRRSLFLNRNWFHHTVLNECHWDCWGATDLARQVRLYADAMESITVAVQVAQCISTTSRDAFLVRVEESRRYLHQMRSAEASVRKNVDAVRQRTRKRIAYSWASIMFWVELGFNRFRFSVKRLISV